MRRKVGDTFTREMDWECSVDKLGQSRFNGTPFRRAKPERNCPRGLDLVGFKEARLRGSSLRPGEQVSGRAFIAKGANTHLVKSF